MSNADLIQTILNLMHVVAEFAPDQPLYDEYNIETVIQDGCEAVEFLKGNNNG